jgi:hypothetical protein
VCDMAPRRLTLLYFQVAVVKNYIIFIIFIYLNKPS